MSVRRFVGANGREAMRQVRAALGDDALILANRRTEQGVEILAMAEQDIGAPLSARTAQAASPAPSPARGQPAVPGRVTLPSRTAAQHRPSAPEYPTPQGRPSSAAQRYRSVQNQASAQMRSATRSRSAAPEPPVYGFSDRGSPEAQDHDPSARYPLSQNRPAERARLATPAHLVEPEPESEPPYTEPPPAEPATSTSAAVPGDAFEAMSTRLLREMREMRDLLAAQKASPAPAAAQAPSAPATQTGRLEELLRMAGYSQAVIQDTLAALPVELDEQAELSWLGERLAMRLAVLEDELGLLDREGIVALIGPTGVGKTTTSAKLAARFVMRHGPDPVALVSTDGFRIGAHEQLRIYADLMGVPMHGLDFEQSLESLLPKLAKKRFVIIDTVGMSQRDRRIIDQIARLQGDRPVRPVLLLNAASQPETLEEVIVNYRQAAQAAGLALEDCIVSKRDESGSLGPLLDALIRHGLRLLFVANGQRVPEDLSAADAHDLVQASLASRTQAPRHEPPVGAGLLLGQGRRLGVLLSLLRERIHGFADLESAWALAGMPTSLQPARLDALLNAAETPLEGRVWMPRTQVRGETWFQPDLCLAADGQWSALPRLQHLTAPVERERLAASAAHGALAAHLLTGLPADDSRRWLAEQGCDWVAQVHGTLRVERDGERYSVSELAAFMTPRHPRRLRWRNRESILKLAVASVSLDGERLRAWQGELQDVQGGKVLKRVYWLTPETLRGRAVPLMLQQLATDALPSLTRRAHRWLSEADPAMSPALCLTLGAGLSAVALQLEASSEAWASTLRGELLGLLASKRRSGVEALLEALLHLGFAREALRELGSVGVEGLH